MVSEPIVADPEVAEQEVTESPAEETPEVAAPPAEPDAAESEGSEPTYTAAEIEAIRQQTAAEAIEYDRRARQSANMRQAQEAQHQQQAYTKLRDAVEIELIKAGTVVDDDTVNRLIQRVGGVRTELAAERVVSDTEQALEYITAPLRGDNRSYEEFGLSPAAEAVARRLVPEIQRLLDTAQPSMLRDYVPKSDIPKLVEAEIAKRNAKSREGKDQLRSPAGTPGQHTDRSHQAIIARIAAGQHDDTDAQYYRDWRASRSK